MKKLFLTLFVLSALLISACSTGLPPASPEVHAFAECLTENEVIMYGTDWCPFCQQQKELFGDAFNSVMYVNCETNPSACNAAGVRSYPTWLVDGQMYSGVQQLYQLAQNSGACSLAPQAVVGDEEIGNDNL